MDSSIKYLDLRAKKQLFYLDYQVIIMVYSCYILFSKSINRYYVGYTSDIDERIKLHNSGSFGNKSYTHCVSDWILFLIIPCITIQQAVFVESKIKRMKSRTYIENLKKYPEIVEKILNEYFC